MFLTLAAGILNTVVSAISTIGPMVANLCTTIIPRILPVLKSGIEICRTVATVANTVATLYDVLRPGESVSDIGDRALQAGKGPEAFDDFSEYMQSLRDMTLDPVKSAKFGAETALIAGLGVIAGGLDERFRVRSGTMSNLWALIAADDYFTAPRLGAILNHTRDIANVIRYFDGMLAPADASRMEDALLAAEHDVFPGKSDDACQATLNDATARMRASKA